MSNEKVGAETLHLKVMREEGASRPIALFDGMILGRDDDADVSLADSKISWHHARIYRARGELGREPVWAEGSFEPFADLALSPAAACQFLPLSGLSSHTGS